MTNEEIIARVLSNEVTCRVYLKELEAKGLKFSKNLEHLTHEECVELAIQIYSEVKRQERK